MNFFKIKSFAKVNLSLGVLGKLKSKLHKIESLFTFLKLYDEILIKQTNNKNHIVKFTGKFSKNISNNNTIVNLLKILDKKNKLSNKKFLIIIKKNIPQRSGMGGGSMNAASLLNYFLKKKKINLNSRQIIDVVKQIGSDVIVGMDKKNSILYGNGRLKNIRKNINLYTVLVKPNFGCSTKAIYGNVRNYSKPIFKEGNKINLDQKLLTNLKNDLEIPVFIKYPILKNTKIFMEKLDNVLFVRMTGSGSTLIGYFKSKKSALNALKRLNKKYKNYWCILSKTI